MKFALNTQWPQHDADKFLFTGIAATLLSLVLLVVPALLKQSSALAFNPPAMNTLGLTIFGLGILFLLAYSLMKIMGSQTETESVQLEQPAALHVLPQLHLVASKPEFIHQQNSLQQNAANAATIQHPTRLWNASSFAKMHSRDFVGLCSALFAQAGFEVEQRTAATYAEGEGQIWLHSSNLQESVLLIECKHMHNHPIGLKEMKALRALMDLNELQRGSYVTTSAFTGDALQFAKDNGINAMNGTKLLALINSRTPEQQKALFAVAYSDGYEQLRAAA